MLVAMTLRISSFASTTPSQPSASCARSPPQIPASQPLRRAIREVRATALSDKSCQPCEEGKQSLDFKSLCESFSEDEAEPLLQQVEPEWQIVDDKTVLKLRRTWKTRNFMSALELCSRFGEIAEAEGHHPDLHLTGWNNLEVTIFTHARDGLMEADFILAAKYDAVAKDDLLSKKKAAT